MKTIFINNYYSNFRATKEMNMSFTSIDIGIVEAINWFNPLLENKKL